MEVKKSCFLKLSLYKPKAAWYVLVVHYSYELQNGCGFFLRFICGDSSSVFYSAKFFHFLLRSESHSSIGNESQTYDWMDMKHRDGGRA